MEPNPSRTLASFMARSPRAALLSGMGSANLGMTPVRPSSSSSTATFCSTAMAASATRRRMRRSRWMSCVATRHMSSRAAVMASALLGLSCTIPSELSGTLVAPLNCLARHISSSTNGCGELPES